PSESPRFTLDVEPIRELGLWSYYALAIEAGLAGEDPFPLFNLALSNIGRQSPQSIIWFVARQTQATADYNQIITGFAPVATWRYRTLDAHIETFGPLSRRALIEQYIADLVLLSAGLENYILAQTIWNAPNKKTANYNPTNRAFLRFVLAERLYETGRANDVVRMLAPISKPAQKSEQFPDILAPHAITAKNIAAILHAEFYTTQVNETDRRRTRAIDRRTRFKRAERERVNTLETNKNTQARATERRGGIYGGGSNEIDTLDLYALEKGIKTLTEQITTLDANIAQNSTKANELFNAATTQTNLSKSDNAFLHRAKGRWLTQRKQYTQSVAAIDKALLYIDPVQNPNGQNDLLYAQAVNYERLGDWDTAERLFRESLESQPENPGVLNYLGYSLLLYRPERIDEATAMIARANSLTNSRSGAILDSLGYAYLLDGRIEEAVTLLESASARLPYSTEVLLHLGDAYWENGRIREAVFQWQRALEELSHSYENIDEAAIEERLARGHEKLDKSR
nr:tetratricopeptide repeat protein [Actinomycetes bacterium]